MCKAQPLNDSIYPDFFWSAHLYPRIDARACVSPKGISSRALFALTFADVFPYIIRPHVCKCLPLHACSCGRSILIVITSVGYGDATPSTPMGRFVIAATAVLSVIFLGMLLSISASPPSLLPPEPTQNVYPSLFLTTLTPAARSPTLCVFFASADRFQTISFCSRFRHQRPSTGGLDREGCKPFSSQSSVQRCCCRCHSIVLQAVQDKYEGRESWSAFQQPQSQESPVCAKCACRV